VPLVQLRPFRLQRGFRIDRPCHKGRIGRVRLFIAYLTRRAIFIMFVLMHTRDYKDIHFTRDRT
jgi:hypothetical protein